MQPLFDLGLPKRRPWPWIAIVASVAAHSVLLFGWVSGRLPSVPPLPRQLIVLAASAQGHEQVPMFYDLPQAVGERRAQALPQARSGRSEPKASRPELPDRQAVRVLPKPVRPVPPLADTGGAAPKEQAPLGRLGPGLAQGRLWVRPLPLPPRELAQRLTKSRAELVDSAVTAIVQQYLDSIANDPASKNQALPSWTTEIAGKKFGLDSKNIYIAGLKIPAVVLALLPIPAGNIDQNRAYNHLMDLRADLLYAARRAETMEEFKKVIREIRIRKEKEREFEKNQRTAPPPEKPLIP
ncbi:MAG TPA: hypothetical protein VGR09_11285 [Gemmatimonadales bacterium]|nr:hypothetical protein [Gemmatimonadales bacterium]